MDLSSLKMNVHTITVKDATGFENAKRLLLAMLRDSYSYPPSVRIDEGVDTITFTRVEWATEQGAAEGEGTTGG